MESAITSGFSNSYSCKLLIMLKEYGPHKRTPMSLRFSASGVTLSGFAGGKYLPLQASKGLALPLRSAEPFGLSSSALSSLPKGSGRKLMSSRSLPKGSGSKTHVTLGGYPTRPADSLHDTGMRSKLRELHNGKN